MDFWRTLIMTACHAVSDVGTAPPHETAASLSRSLKSFTQRMKTWVGTCADYYEATSLYDELRRLSDAELRKRGLSRDTVARDVCQACDRSGFR